MIRACGFTSHSRRSSSAMMVTSPTTPADTAVQNSTTSYEMLHIALRHFGVRSG